MGPYVGNLRSALSESSLLGVPGGFGSAISHPSLRLTAPKKHRQARNKCQSTIRYKSRARDAYVAKKLRLTRPDQGSEHLDPLGALIRPHKGKREFPTWDSSRRLGITSTATRYRCRDWWWRLDPVERTAQAQPAKPSSRSTALPAKGRRKARRCACRSEDLLRSLFEQLLNAFVVLVLRKPTAYRAS